MIKLTKIVDKDYDTLHFINQIIADDNIKKWMNGIPYYLDAVKNGQVIMLKASNEKNDIGLGIISIESDDTCEVRYCILSNYINNGYGTILLKELCLYIKNYLNNIKEIVLNIDNKNVQSISVAKNNDFIKGDDFFYHKK